MARKLHRRSGEHQYFPKGKNEGSYQSLNVNGAGLDHAIGELRGNIHREGDFGNHYNADRVLRMVESGFSDDDIAEFLLIPVEEVEEIIENDRVYQNKMREGVIKLLGL